MKAKTPHLSQMNTPGIGDLSSNRESLTTMLKHWRQRLGYYSIFAALPGMLVSGIQKARVQAATKPEVSVAGKGTRLLERLNRSYSSSALLKRQSRFRLPHQKGSSFDMFPALGGNDDCPGRAIQGGNYTAAAPYIDSGDTTGANDTVTTLPSFYYYFYTYAAHGPDNVYSFTLTGRGPKPKIEVSATSGTYKPLIYVLKGGDTGGCPAGTKNFGSSEMVMFDTRWSSDSSTATLDDWAMNFLPLNVPLYLFVDSAENDPSGSGSYTIRMQDVTIAPTPIPNQIDDTQFFVRQHYSDFLNRVPDAPGLAFWTNEISMCGGDQRCIEAKRINVSAAYFLSIEFQQTGYLVYRFYKAAYGNVPNAPVPLRLNEFLPDTKEIGQGVVVNQAGWEQLLESNKQAFATAFVQRPRFTSAYPTSMSSEQFVDALFAKAEVTPSASERTAVLNEFAFAASTADVAARARALRRVAENSTLAQQEFTRAFVLMQYFGYMRRNPNDAPDGDFTGFNFWLNKLNQYNGDYGGAEMVKAFLVSGEYRRRFGS